MSRQVVNYRAVVEQLRIYLGNETSVTNYLSKCIYSIGIGGNDYINNYFLPAFYPTSRLYSPQQYATLLIQQYTEQLKVSENTHTHTQRSKQAIKCTLGSNGN